MVGGIAESCYIMELSVSASRYSAELMRMADEDLAGVAALLFPLFALNPAAGDCENWKSFDSNLAYGDVAVAQKKKKLRTDEQEIKENFSKILHRTKVKIETTHN